MKKLITLALVLASITGFSQSVNIPFKVCPKSSLLIVGLNLNDHYAMFLIDCDSELTVLDESQASVFGYGEADADDDNSQNVSWSGSSVNVSNAKYASIQIGTIQVNDGIKVADVRKLLGTISSTVSANVIGIIGSNVLRSKGLVIDYKSNSLHN
jgi:hypothetical protein